MLWHIVMMKIWFLSECSNEELNDLVYLLTHDKDGEKRWTEELTNNSNYKAFYPNHSLYWEEIAAEIQLLLAVILCYHVCEGKGVYEK